MLYFR